MEKQYCKRCHTTKSVELFDGIHKYCIRCLEKDENYIKTLKKDTKNKEQNIHKNIIQNIKKN